MKKLSILFAFILCLVNAFCLMAFATEDSSVDYQTEYVYNENATFASIYRVDDNLSDMQMSVKAINNAYEDVYDGTTYYKIGSTYYALNEENEYVAVTDSELIAQLNQLEFSKVSENSVINEIARTYATTNKVYYENAGMLDVQYNPSIMSATYVVTDVKPFYSFALNNSATYVGAPIILDWGFYLLVFIITITIIVPYFVLFIVKSKEKTKPEDNTNEEVAESVSSIADSDESMLYGKSISNKHKWTLDYFVFLQALVCVVCVVTATMYSTLTSLFISSIIAGVASCAFAIVCAYKSSLKLRMILINASAILCAICLFCMFADMGWWLQSALSIGISVLVSLGIPFCKNYVATRLTK